MTSNIFLAATRKISTALFLRNRRLLLLIPILLSLGTPLFAQQKITGVITGIDHTPLFSATVTVKSTGKATTTDASGRFSIQAKRGDILIVSYVGYMTKEITMGNETSLAIPLCESLANLDEIIVTGYTSQKIKEITGSVAVVKPKDLKAVPAGQVEQMLQGRVAGLTIITSGMPGGKSNVRLHGIGNFGNVTPLYIIDGIEGDINNLNPDDIESLQVLKDAGAYAIYGVRGANGVIIVTTKKGISGKPTITYNFYIARQVPLENGFNPLTPQEAADLDWLAKRNSGQVDSLENPFSTLYGNGPKPILPDYIVNNLNGYSEGDPEVDPSLYNLYGPGDLYQIAKANKTGTDWFHEVFKPAISQSHTVTASGGNDKSKYLFSLGYLDQQGTLLNTYLKRYTARINTSFTIKNSLHLGENLQLVYRDNPQIANQQPPYAGFVNFHSYPNEIQAVFSRSTIMPVYDIKGNWTSDLGPEGPQSNPVARRVIAKDDKGNLWEVFGNVYAEISFLKNFIFRSSFGGTQTNYNSYYYQYGSYNRSSQSYVGNKNYFNERAGYAQSWTWTNTLNFSKTFKKFHSITLLTGTEAISNYSREVGGTRSDYFTDDPSYRFLSTGSTIVSVYSNANQYTLFSIINQLNYGFRDKYFIKGTLRRDGSSVFGPESRYGWFPSVSASWNITKENFISSLAWFTDMRLRASWGKTGFYGNTDPNNQYDLFGSNYGQSFYDIYGRNTSTVLGFMATRIGDTRTSWQQDVVTNIGLDAALWKGKVSITADVYKKESSGLLLPAVLPGTLGVLSWGMGRTPPNINIGNVRNTGLDLLLGSKGSFSKDWNWDVALTFTTYKNKIVRLNGDPYFFVGDFVKNEVGHPMGAFYGYKVIGLFEDWGAVSKSPGQDAAAPGRFKYLDANGDDTITDADRVYLGDPNPKFTLGINVEITYKNFDFSTFLYGSFGNDAWNTFNPHGEPKALLYNSWTPDRKNTAIPIVETSGTFSNGYAPCSYSVVKGSYLRNKSLILGYTFSENILKRINIDRLRIYAQAVNLFTITKYVGLDPELSGASNAWGIDYGNYPNNQKEYLIGLNVNF